MYVLATLQELQLSTLFFFFTLCNARVSELNFALTESLCERIRKLETCPILKEDRSLVRV
jgi:hypothetical protein